MADGYLSIKMTITLSKSAPETSGLWVRHYQSKGIPILRRRGLMLDGRSTIMLMFHTRPVILSLMVFLHLIFFELERNAILRFGCRFLTRRRKISRIDKPALHIVAGPELLQHHPIHLILPPITHYRGKAEEACAKVTDNRKVRSLNL